MQPLRYFTKYPYFSKIYYPVGYCHYVRGTRALTSLFCAVIGHMDTHTADVGPEKGRRYVRDTRALTPLFCAVARGSTRGYSFLLLVRAAGCSCIGRNQTGLSW
jgi:hypothetical protein